MANYIEKTYQQLMAFEQELPEQQAKMLADLHLKTVEELLGAWRYFFQYMTPITTVVDSVDIVGTGGDGLGTFNISTAASLVVAACGVPVTKHGGRSARTHAGV